MISSIQTYFEFYFYPLYMNLISVTSVTVDLL